MKIADNLDTENRKVAESQLEQLKKTSEEISEDMFQKIGTLLGYWGGTADMDDEGARLAALDPNNEKQMKEIIKSDIVGFYMKELNKDKYRKEAIDGLKHALDCPTEHLHQYWNSNLIAFDLPDDPRDLFIWIKEVFEEYQIYITEYE